MLKLITLNFKTFFIVFGATVLMGSLVQNWALRQERDALTITAEHLQAVNNANVEVINRVNQEREKQRVIIRNLQAQHVKNNQRADARETTLENARGRLSDAAKRKTKLVEDTINRATADVLCALQTATGNDNPDGFCRAP